jgi:hypothetical protein
VYKNQDSDKQESGSKGLGSRIKSTRMDYDSIDDYGAASKVFFLDTNLSSPVLITEIDSTMKMIKNYLNRKNPVVYEALTDQQKNEVNFFIKLCNVRKWSDVFLRSAKLLDPVNYEDVEKQFLSGSNSNSSSYTIAKQVCEEIELAVAAGLERRGLPSAEIIGTTDLMGCEESLPYRAAYEEFTNFFGRAESRVKVSEYQWTRGLVGNVTIWITATKALLMIDKTLYISSLNQILMLKDKLATRYLLLEHVLPLGLDKSLINSLLILFKWQDETLTSYGNEAYGILKAVEPMFKTRLSHITDNIFGNDTAYTRMLVKIEEKELKIKKITGIKTYNQTQQLQYIVESVKGVRNIVELFGCQKSCGHPLIDPELGGLSAAEEARSADKTSLVDAQELRNVFCHTVLTSYVRQHGRWPRLIHMKPGTTLRALNDRQERNLDYNSYPFDDWNTTEWTKIMDFDYFPNFLELMDDKSISLYRSEKHLTWDAGPKPSSQRRLLLELLHRSSINIKDIVERVSKRDIPWDWFIVSLYPKEREFKIDPRMFAMLVLEMRCFFTAIEANLADKLFRYLPQQTMTNTKTQNQERFLSFTDPSKQSGSYTLFIEIDLTRWNLRWRQLVIQMLGHDINMMFGVKGTFTVTHWFFARCQVLVRVAGLRPDKIEQRVPPTTGLAWSDHKGGFEGLNQKLWTAATYAMMETGLIPLMRDGTITSYELIGQGDNQVVRLAIPPGDRSREDLIPEVRDRVNGALEEACRRVNQIVKPDENIESTSVLTYSKDVFVNGVEYPTSLKKHSRLFPVTSLDFPSVASNTRAILSGAVSGAENSMYPLRSLIIGVYHASRYLHAASKGFSVHGSDYPSLNLRELVAAMVLPSSIGGLTGVNLASFFYKGGSDPLGKEISGMRLMAEGNSIASQVCSSALRALEERYHVSVNPDLTTLIDNPYGLPLEKPSSPLSRVGHLTLDAFRPKVNNCEIKPLLTNSVLRAEETLKRDLIKIVPCNPILIHDLFEASGFGTIKLMRKMFVHTRTVQSVAQWVNPNITHVFLEADLNDSIGFKRWLSGLPSRGYSGRSSYDLTISFRAYWGTDLHGVSSHQPLDCLHVPNSTRSPNSVKWSAHSASDLLTTRGPLSGYIGTATREKRSEHGYKIVDTGAPSRALTKLQLIRSQAYGDNNFNELLDRLAFTRSPVRLSLITDYLPKVIGGSIVHRLASTIRSMAASYVGPLNFVTHIRLDTDSIGVISGSALNFAIMIQEFIVVAQAGAKLLHVHHRVQSGELIIDTSVMSPLPDDALYCPPPVFKNSELPQSILMYSNTLSLARTYDNVAGAIPNHAVIRPNQYESQSSIFDSFVGFFITTLRDQNRAKTIADNRGHVSIPAKYQIDIAEAHAFGPLRILETIAHAIILTSIRDTFRTIQLHPERWDEVMFMVHNITVCLKACAGYWSHPLFSTHRDFATLRSSSLVYGNNQNKYKRLEARVRRQMSKILTGYTHRFWKTRIPVFAGENQTQLAEAMTTAGARAVYRMRIAQHPEANTCARLYSGYMRLPKNTTFSSPDIMDLLRIRLTGLSQLYGKIGLHTLRNEILDISEVKYMAVYNDDIRTVMRHARSWSPTTRVPPIASLRSSIKNFIHPNDHCPLCLPPTLSKHAVIWERNRQRLCGGISSAGYTWVPILSQLKLSKTVLIVGNGNGGLADLLISAYAVDIIGLDLETDLPKDMATLMNYLPLGIQTQNRGRFLQSDLSLSTSGDWTDPIVRSAVLATLPSLTTVIVDATGPTPASIVQSCKDSMDSTLVSNMFCRLIGEDQDVLDALSSLKNWCETQFWVCSRSRAELEVIVHCSRSELKIHKCSGSPCLSHLQLSEDMHSIIPHRYGELLEAATRHCINWEGESLTESYKVIHNMCNSLLNKPQHQQLRYVQRFDLIVAYSLLYAVNSGDTLNTIREWIADEVIETDLFTFGTREDVITHLLRYGARLSGLSQQSILFFS